MSKITPLKNGNGIAIQFQYQHITYKFTPVPRGRFENKVDYGKACAIAEQIERDIKLGEFDPTLEKYKPKKIDKVKVQSDSLLNLWSFYKEDKASIVAETTKLREWRQVDIALKWFIGNKEEKFLSVLNKNQPHLFVQRLLECYSPSTARQICTNLLAAINHCEKKDYIDSEMYKKWKDVKSLIPKKERSESHQKAFSESEISEILKAFRRNTYRENSVYYANFVEFLIITGCRPQDAIALEWSDIEKEYILFNKAYRQGVLKGTKNNKERKFPLTKRLEILLDNQEIEYRAYNSDKPDLVFPYHLNQDYINLGNFTKNYFGKVIEGLLKDGKILSKLTTRKLRNTAASFYYRAGVDKRTIGELIETGTDMLDRHYLAPNQDVILPEIEF